MWHPTYIKNNLIKRKLPKKTSITGESSIGGIGDNYFSAPLFEAQMSFAPEHSAISIYPSFLS